MELENKTVIQITEQPTNTIEKVVKVKENLNPFLVELPLMISIACWLIKEIAAFLIRRKTAEYTAQIEKQKVEEQEKAARIEYLEKQNEMLLSEILSLRLRVPDNAQKN